jgi:hypothetical protein
MSLSPATTLVLSKLGAMPALGAVVSRVAVSDVLTGELFPAASCTLTVTVNAAFSAGFANVVVAKPLLMSVAVRVSS